MVWYITGNVKHKRFYKHISHHRIESCVKVKDPLFYLAIISVVVDSLNCTYNQSKLTVQPGGLPWHRIQWVVQPEATVHCSSPQPQWIDITSHRLATVVLTVDVREPHIECRLSFRVKDTNKIKPSKTKLSVSGEKSYNSDAVWNYPHLRTFYTPTVIRFTRNPLVFTVKTFKYAGGFYNMKHSLV